MNLPSHIQTAVIGAGTAGLAAAKSLQQVGIETVVLEAAGHVGGRCTTDTSVFDTPFDRGGSWLHSAPINPLARLAEQTGATLHKQPWLRKHVHALGKDLSPAEVQDLVTYEKALWDEINTVGATGSDCIIKSVMPDSRWLATAEHLIPQMLSGDADQTSAQDVYNYADAQGDWLVEEGLGAFVARLHKNVPVWLNCPVTKIDYSGAGVKLTTALGTLHADQVILTVSTEILAAETIAFVPELPKEKTEAAHLLPCGLLNKIGIEFDPNWKGATQGEMVDYHGSDAEFCSLLFGFCGTPLAVGFVAGRFADALELQGAGAATDYCLEGLRANFGTDVMKYVLRTDETAWRGDVLALGSYSYAKPGAAGARQTLAEPVSDRLFFAGEATMTDTYSTVHGAFQSGQRAANEIIVAQQTTPETGEIYV